MRVHIRMFSIFGRNVVTIKSLGSRPKWMKGYLPKVALLTQIEKTPGNLKVKDYNYLDAYTFLSFSICRLYLLPTTLFEFKARGAMTAELASPSGTWVAHLSSSDSPVYLLRYIRCL